MYFFLRNQDCLKIGPSDIKKPKTKKKSNNLNYCDHIVCNEQMEVEVNSIVKIERFATFFDLKYRAICCSLRPGTGHVVSKKV